MTGPPSEVVLGERARAQAALVLEQQLGATWLLILEALGADVEAGWSVVVDGLRLVKSRTEPSPNGRPPPASGAATAAEAHPPSTVRP